MSNYHVILFYFPYLTIIAAQIGKRLGNPVSSGIRKIKGNISKYWGPDQTKAFELLKEVLKYKIQLHIPDLLSKICLLKKNFLHYFGIRNFEGVKQHRYSNLEAGMLWNILSSDTRILTDGTKADTTMRRECTLKRKCKTKHHRVRCLEYSLRQIKYLKT